MIELAEEYSNLKEDKEIAEERLKENIRLLKKLRSKRKEPSDWNRYNVQILMMQINREIREHAKNRFREIKEETMEYYKGKESTINDMEAEMKEDIRNAEDQTSEW